MLLGFGGGLMTLTKSYEYLRDSGRDVERFDPWKQDLSDFDLIHHFGFHYSNWEWFKTIKRFNKRLAVTTMYWIPEDPFTERLYRKLLSRIPYLKLPPVQTRQMLEMADLILPNSEGEKQLLINLFGCSEEKMHIVPCGVDDRFGHSSAEPFEQKFGISNFLLCVGRFDSAQKNQLGMVRALGETGLPMVFIGGPADGQEGYYEQCRREAPEGTLFIGVLDPADPILASALVAANTLVIPSYFEYPCMVAMEALLAATKVAITRRGTTEEYFREYAAYFDPRSPADIRRVVLETFQAEIHPEAQRYARRVFRWDHVGHLLDKAYAAAGFA